MPQLPTFMTVWLSLVEDRGKTETVGSQGDGEGEVLPVSKKRTLVVGGKGKRSI